MKTKKINFDISVVTLDNVDEIANQILNNEPQNYILQLADKNLEISFKRLAINLFFIAITNKYQIPLESNMLFLDKQITNKVIYQKLSNIYQKAIDIRIPKDILIDMRWDFWFLINWINNFILYYCQEYHRGLNINELVEIKEQSEIKKLLETELDQNLGTKEIENQINKIKKELTTLLMNYDHPKNVLKPFLNLNLINENQIAHTLYKIGFRTDIDDKVVPYLVNGNYLDGLKDPMEFILESLSAKKSIIYSKLSLPEVQYFNRTQQLATTSVAKIYRGDCKSNNTIPYLLTESNYKNFIGKNIIDDKKLITLTNQNIKKYIDTIIEMRSPLTCLHPHGTCEVCGGDIVTYYIHPHFNIGHIACIDILANTAQRVLSAKHYQTTNSLEYEIPAELKPFFKKVKNKLYLKQNVNRKNLKLVLLASESKFLLNLKNLQFEDVSDINEFNFGRFSVMSLLKNDEFLTDNVFLEYCGTRPNLSKEFIMYLKENFHKTSICNDFYIPLDDFDPSQPIFVTSIVNDSIIEFVEKLKRFIKKELHNFNSAIEALNEFSSLIYERGININIVFLELMLKGYYVTNDLDYGISSIDVIRQVQFGKDININQFRHLGVLFSFERLPKALTTPSLYLIPKSLHNFDYLLGYHLD